MQTLMNLQTERPQSIAVEFPREGSTYHM